MTNCCILFTLLFSAIVFLFLPYEGGAFHTEEGGVTVTEVSVGDEDEDGLDEEGNDIRALRKHKSSQGKGGKSRSAGWVTGEWLFCESRHSILENKVPHVTNMGCATSHTTKLTISETSFETIGSLKARSQHEQKPPSYSTNAGFHKDVTFYAVLKTPVFCQSFNLEGDACYGSAPRKETDSVEYPRFAGGGGWTYMNSYAVAALSLNPRKQYELVFVSDFAEVLNVEGIFFPLLGDFTSKSISNCDISVESDVLFCDETKTMILDRIGDYMGLAYTTFASSVMYVRNMDDCPCSEHEALTAKGPASTQGSG